MKRICLILLALTLPLVSCQSVLSVPQGIQEQTDEEETAKMQPDEKETAKEQKMTETKKESYDYPPVCDKLSLEKINSFPIANADMTKEELRSLCVEFFAYCQSFAWTPAEDYTYTIKSKNRDVTLKQGTVYGGLPYVTSGRGNIYHLMEYYDEETGVVDVKKVGADPVRFGNQCSFGSFWAWTRVVNSAAFGGTNHLVAKNGFIPVGPYTYDTDIDVFGNPDTPTICNENGEQTMYLSYAAMKPADGLVRSKGAGHVIMCATAPVVVKNADGSINGEESYFTYIHQASGWSDQKQSDGSAFRAQTVPYTKKTFAETFKESYLPFTFAEFLGTDPVENATTDFSHEKETVTIEELKLGTITSNYPISHAVLTVTDENGTVLLKKSFFCEKINQRNFCLGSAMFPAEINPLAKENRNITITCRLGNGETPTVYQGTLVSEK